MGIGLALLLVPRLIAVTGRYLMVCLLEASSSLLRGAEVHAMGGIAALQRLLPFMSAAAFPVSGNKRTLAEAKIRFVKVGWRGVAQGRQQAMTLELSRPFHRFQIRGELGLPPARGGRTTRPCSPR